MKENKVYSVKYNFIMNFILTASNFIFPLLTFPYVSRTLTASGNGKLSFASSVANYFILVASLGIPTYGVRACAKVRDDKEALSRTVQELLMINAIMTSLVSLTYIAAVMLVPRFQEDKIIFYINGINIILNMFGVNWFFQALEQYRYITIRSLIFKILSIILMFIFVHQYDDYIIYCMITVFASVGSNLLNFTRMRQYIHLKPVRQYDLKRHIKPILIMFAQTMAVSVYTNLDTIMLGFLKSEEEVGFYQAATKIRGILVSLVCSLGNVLLPRMSYFAKNNLVEKFNQMIYKALNFTMMLSFPLCFYFALYAERWMLILAGDGYLGAVDAMRIIVIAIIPVGITNVIGVQVLTAIEREKLVLYSIIIGAVTDFLLNLILIPSYGASGAAFATMSTEFMVLVMQVIFARDILINVKRKINGIKYIVFSSISVFICLIFNRIEKFSVFSGLILSVFIYFFSYACILLLNKEPLLIEYLNLFINKIFDNKKSGG